LQLHKKEDKAATSITVFMICFLKLPKGTF